MFDINWSLKALRQLEKIRNRVVQKVIFNAVDALKDYPGCPNIKALKAHKYEYRLRVGRYRVFFNIREKIELIHIEEVKKRDERTY